MRKILGSYLLSLYIKNIVLIALSQVEYLVIFSLQPSTIKINQDPSGGAGQAAQKSACCG